MATKKPIKKTTKSTTTRRPVKATTKTRRTTKPVSRRTTKPVTKKPAVKRTTSKKVATRKPVTKRTTTKSSQLTKINKLFVYLLGSTMMAIVVFLTITIVSSIINSTKPQEDKTVLGYRVSVGSKIPHSSFKDKNFYACVIGNLNAEKINRKTNRTFSHKATDAELKGLYGLNCSNGSTAKASLKIENTAGLEKMTGLRSINMSNNLIKSINLSKQKKLEHLFLTSNKLSSINLDNQQHLTGLYLGHNKLSSLNLRNQTKLFSLQVDKLKPTNVRIFNTYSLIGPVSGNKISTRTISRSEILNSVVPISKKGLDKYIVNSSGRRVTSGKYESGDVLVVKTLGVEENRVIWVDNPQSFLDKVTDARWHSLNKKKAKAGIKFKSTYSGYEQYEFICYYNAKLIIKREVPFKNKKDGYRYSNKTDYPVYDKKSGITCFIRGTGINMNNKHYYGLSAAIK